MSRTTALVTAFVFVIFGGVVHGLWTDRWVVSKEPGAAAANLIRLPMTIGDWEGQAINVKSSRSGQRQLGGIMRRYTNRLDGTTVSILLVCGRPGPVSVHTPDVCYDGAGYDLAAGALDPRTEDRPLDADVDMADRLLPALAAL